MGEIEDEGKESSWKVFIFFIKGWFDKSST